MAKSDSHLNMTSDDQRAARVLTLAVKFFGATLPIPASTINADLYPDLDSASFSRQFLRDRELLASFGIVIREVESFDNDTRWQVDESSSYVQGEGLGTKDACMLYVLCHDMAFDQAFPYRDELRMALAKISRMYRGSFIPHTDTTTPAQHKLLAVLVSCMSNRHGVAVSYTDAQGTTSNRTLALLGSFGLRGNTYFVASRVKNDGTLVPDSVRTYRLDRFQKARELPTCSYQVPLDFAVSDYERLPFQMGDTIGTARFAIPSVLGKQLARALATHGQTHDEPGESVWEVAYSDVTAAAAWAVGSGISPIAPDELCAAWQTVLSDTASAKLYDPGLSSSIYTNQAPQRKPAGRKGSIAVARQLVALATSLTREGEVITAQNIATTLGISFDEARHLIALVSLGSGESIDYLPVILSDDDDEVSLMEGAALGGRRVRLTLSETIALTAALTELGVNQDDPLVRILTASYAAPSFSREDVERTLETPSSASDSATLRQCSQAISAGRGLSFLYRPVSGGEPTQRSVIPQLVRRSDDSWYLDGYDLVRQDQRVFRIDRMSELEEIDAPMPVPSFQREQAEQMVTVHFADQRYLDLFHWDGMQLLAQDDAGTTVQLPQYGGTWLVRHLAACAGTVRIDDEQLATQVRSFAQELLNR